MSKVSHLISCLDVGGAEMSLLRLLGSMDRKRFQTVVTSMIPTGKIGHQIEGLGIPVRSLQLRRGAVSPSALIHFVRELKRDQPDVLMTWLYHSDLLGVLAGKLAKVPAIIWNLRASGVDMSHYPRLSGLTVRACSALSSWPDAVIANSESGKAYHSSIGYRPRKWAVIRNGVDTEVFRPDPATRERLRGELGLYPDETAIGLIARFDPMKDHANLLAAAAIAGTGSPGCRFFLAGKGVTADNPYFKVHCAEGHPQAGRIRLLGERHDIPELMAALDIACSSSRSEAFPNVVAEAMSSGLTCVATDVGDTADILAGVGIVVPPCNAEALADGLLRAVDMGPEGRAAMGSAARNRILDRFGIQRYVQDYEAFLAGFARA